MNVDLEKWIARRKWPLFRGTLVRGQCWVEAEGKCGTAAVDTAGTS
jgi:hypothetical protein